MLTAILTRVEERLAVVGLSPTRASKLAGLSGDAIRNLKRATDRNSTRTGITTRTLNALAPVLQTSSAYLLGETDDPAVLADESVAVVPVISWVSAGRLRDVREPTPGEAERRLLIGGLGGGDFFGLVVDGTSMDRVSPPGSIIIVDRGDRDPRAGRAYIFARGGETTFKRYEDDPVVRLEPDTTDTVANKTLYPREGEEWDVVGRVRRTVLDL